VDFSGDFLALLRRHSLAVLNNIVTIDEFAISFHTPEMKRESKQWVKKDQPGPRKSKAHATQTKKMVLVFFDAKGVIYMNYVCKVETVNAKYIKKALARFLKVIKANRVIMSSQDWFLHWDNARSIPPPKSRNTWRRRGSRRFVIRPLRRISPWRTSSSSQR
jgi:hypothetical protein